MHATILPRVLPAVLLTAAALCGGSAGAQEFRVFTRIYDVSHPTEANTPLSHSTTLFHAGRVYDYVGPAGELIVIDHANRNITLLDTERRVMTSVDFDEINHLLKRSREETLRYADELAKQPGGTRTTDVLRFHLDPKFDEVFDADRRRLELRSEHVLYSAACAKPEREEQVEAYLQYADWASRLNHVLNPHAPYPAPRIALNAALRTRGLLPVEVSLEIRTEAGPRRFRATHSTHWQLNATDRRLIHHWTSLLADDAGTKRVKFVEYQRTVLTAKAR